MDKETLSNYGWIVVCVMVLAVMIALATPFGSFIKSGVENTAQGLFDTSDKALGVIGASNGGSGNSGNTESVTMLDGDGQTFNKTTDTGLTFRSSAPIDTFKEVKVDGVVVDASHYTVTEGSTIVTFDDEYSKVLNEGKHDIEIISKTGSAIAIFYVESANKQTILEVGGKVPEGGAYFVQDDNGPLTTFTLLGRELQVNGYLYNPGETIPAFSTADWFITYYYAYKYDSETAGWHVIANQIENFTSYDEMYSSINGVSVTSLKGTFQNCTALTTAPTIPSSVKCLIGTFVGCTSLETAPAIPNSVTDVSNTFQNCTSLTTAPVIPNSVTDVRNTFVGCTSLTGNIEINATPTKYENCFYETLQPIKIVGSCGNKAELAATATNNNVTYE